MTESNLQQLVKAYEDSNKDTLNVLTRFSVEELWEIQDALGDMEDNLELVLNRKQ